MTIRSVLLLVILALFGTLTGVALKDASETELLPR